MISHDLSTSEEAELLSFLDKKVMFSHGRPPSSWELAEMLSDKKVAVAKEEVQRLLDAGLYMRSYTQVGQQIL
jgi:predicted transcriptional regulator